MDEGKDGASEEYRLRQGRVQCQSKSTRNILTAVKQHVTHRYECVVAHILVPDYLGFDGLLKVQKFVFYQVL